MTKKKPLLCITVSVIFTVLIFFTLGWLKVVDYKIMDQMFELRGPGEFSESINVVAMGDGSLNALGRWPWRRAYMASFINIMNKYDLRTLVFDVLFLEEDEEHPGDDVLLRNQTELLGNVLYPFYGIPEHIYRETTYKIHIDETQRKILEKSSLGKVSELENPENLIEVGGVSLPISSLCEVAAGVGAINADSDSDGIYRRVPLVLRFEDLIVPNMALASVLNYLGAQKEDVTITPGRSITIKTDSDTIVIPVDSKYQMMVNHTGDFKPDNINVASFIQIVRSDYDDMEDPPIDLTILKEKMAFIGLTGTGTADLSPTPYSNVYPMVGFLATISSNILEGNFLRPVPSWVNYFIIVSIILMAILITVKFKALPSAILNIIMGTVYFYLSYMLFKNEYVVSTFYPLMGIFFSYTSFTVYKFATEEEEKKIIRNMFQRYVSTQVVDVLLDKPDQIRLGGQRKLLTVFFSDIRGFTSMSEKLQPEEVVQVLNEYLTEMIKIVFKYNGTLDKFMGDAVMALWGAPVEQNDHSIQAVRAAWEMKKTLKKLQKKWAREGKKSIAVGMGINTGDVVVGNMGSEQFADYTVIGDNVNLAARLEENAEPDQILISETTYEQVKDMIRAKKMPPLKVKGKEKPVKVYEVLEVKN